jgi:Transglutaminase-like superfamily
VKPITPINLDKLPPGRRLRLTTEVLWTYSRVRWVMRGDDAELAVRRLRTDARGPVKSPASEQEQGLELLAAWRLAHATRRVLESLPSDSRCLFRSLTLMCLLERRGISQTLVVAVRPRPFGAHAWLEVSGEAVLPEADPGYERLLEL